MLSWILLSASSMKQQFTGIHGAQFELITVAPNPSVVAPIP